MPHARQDRAKLSAASGWLVGLSLAGALIGWGWAWVGIRAAVRHYEPGTMALGRHLIAAVALLPFWLARGAKLPARSEWPRVTAMGVLGFAVYNLLINTRGLIPVGWGLPEAVRTAPWTATANMVALGVVSGALCQTMWNVTISRMPLARAANWRFLIPAISVALGWLLLGELPAPAAFAGGVVTLCGVLIVDRLGRATAWPPAAVPDGLG